MIISMSFTALGEYGKYKVSLTSEQNGKHHHTPSQYKKVENASMGGSTYVVPIMNNVGNTNDAYITNDSGNGEPHENIQPSKSVYFWKRTA